MPTERSLREAIGAIEAQRGALGDAVVDASLGALRAQLAALKTNANAPVQALKQVSILFLDVVGSTTLAQQLDPEEVGLIMDGVLARGSVIVERHGGRVLQYAGDNILAGFGADASFEDDAENAVRCGLALLALGRDIGQEVESRHRHAGFAVRVGVHTGGVLLGGGVDADGSIRGSAVNVAARMEQTAPSGCLRISHDTYALVRGLFEVEAQEPLQVKGVDTPIQSYLVTRAKPRSFRIGTRGIEGVATRMIGRDAELAILQDLFLRLFAERGFAIATIVADAGIGKSRLLYEFEAWAEARPERFFIFRGRATPHTENQPFGLLRDILAWRFQIADDDTIAAARSKLEDGIVPLFVQDDGFDLAEGHAHLLGHLIGIEYRDSRHVRGILADPKQIRHRALHTAAQLFRRVHASDGAPIVLQLEDLHWADNESLDFLDALAVEARELPMLIVATTRATLFERARPAGRREELQRRIDLHPLQIETSRLLVDELLKKLPSVPAALQELVIGGAEGNPFYMEELVKMLIDGGAIEIDAASVDGHWRVDAERLRSTRVPPTLTGVLQARLDSLPDVERTTLQGASVIGPRFWDQALTAIDDNASSTLPALERRELVSVKLDAETPAEIDGLREFAFRHALLHQVTYQTVLRQRKRELHGTVARWLAAQTGLRANDFLAAIAEHFALAGDDADAAEYHARAAEYAHTRFAHDGVIAHVEKALRLLARAGEDRSDPARDDALRWRLLHVRETVLDLRGRRSEQRADLDALAALAEAAGDDHRRAYVAWRNSYTALRVADWSRQEGEARRGIALAAAAGDDELRLRCTRLVALALIYLGKPMDGRTLAEDALGEATAAGFRDVQAALLNALSIIAHSVGDAVKTLEYARRTLVLYQELGNRLNEAIALSNIGTGLVGLGAIEAGRSALEEALKLLRANGDRVIEANTLCTLSEVARLHHEHREALTFARTAQAIAVDAASKDFESLALVNCGESHLAMHDFDAATAAFEAAFALTSAISHPYQHDAIVGLARVCDAQGDAAGALAQVGRLLAHDVAGGRFDSVIFQRLLELTCFRVLHAARDPRAITWLAKARAAVLQTAEGISDAVLREGYLTNIPENVAILAAWSATDGASTR